MNLKKEAAKNALAFIKDKSIVGLGAGATIGYLVDFLEAEIRNGLKSRLVTSSFTTHQLLLQKGLPVEPIVHFAAIDIYFDGCDLFDKDLNALKSGGGIHTREKLLASMARQFFLVGDETKYADQLDARFPLVIEVLPEASLYTPACLQKLFPAAKTKLRMSDKKEGPALTDNGNCLFDAWFAVWPDLQELNTAVKAITGVVETSLFYKLAHKAIIATPDKIKILERALPD